MTPAHQIPPLASLPRILQSVPITPQGIGFLKGNFIEGKLSGDGYVSFHCGIQMEGSFQNGKLNGFGKIIFADKSTQSGFFIDNQLHGWGEETSMLGHRIGNFYQGVFHGEDNFAYLNPVLEKVIKVSSVILSVPIWLNGVSSIQGNLMNGKLCGQGAVTFLNGIQMEGCFGEGKLNGPGKIIFSDKSTQSGHFINNQLHGWGVDTSERGLYVGNFYQGNFHGEGTFSYKDGRSFAGIFYKGVMLELKK